jgi:hypothetical protein
MRTFAVILGTIIVCLMVGIGGYLIGTSGPAVRDPLTATYNEYGNVELTSRYQGDLVIYWVAYNERRNCSRLTSFWYHRWEWNREWRAWQDFGQKLGTAPFTLREGLSVAAPFPRPACGETVVRAEVETSLGRFVFRIPVNQQTALTRPKWVPMARERWYDLH